MSQRLLREFIRNQLFVLIEADKKQEEKEEKDTSGDEESTLGFDLSAFKSPETKEDSDSLYGQSTLEKETPQSKMILKTLDNNNLIQNQLKGVKRTQDLNPVISKLLDKTNVPTTDTQRSLKALEKGEKEQRKQDIKTGETSKVTVSTSSSKPTKGTK